MLRWLQRLLVIAGAAMLVVYGLLVYDAGVSQQAARRALEMASRAGAPASSPSAEQPEGITRKPGRAKEAPATAPRVVKGSPLADLSIPRVQLSAVVLHGSDDQTLRRGPGHLENTALPGDTGNAVIAGHRDTFFRPLRNVKRGDDIFVDTPRGRFHYRVTSLRVVKPRDLSVLEPTDEATLTLITCYPFWVVGPAPDRFIVRATRVVSPVAAKVEMPVARPRPSIPPSVVQQPAATASVVRKAATGAGDEDLVRQAIDRFRLAYNARLISHNDQSSAPLGFQTCDVALGGDRATATCRDSSRSADLGDADHRAFTLERAESGWAIATIEIR